MQMHQQITVAGSLGIGRTLACIERGLRDRLYVPQRRIWARRFLGATYGRDTARVAPRFFRWLLAESLPRAANCPQARAAIEGVIALLDETVIGTPIMAGEWIEAATKATAATNAARWSSLSVARAARAAGEVAWSMCWRPDLAPEALLSAIPNDGAHDDTISRMCDRLIDLLLDAPAQGG